MDDRRSVRRQTGVKQERSSVGEMNSVCRRLLAPRYPCCGADNPFRVVESGGCDNEIRRAAALVLKRSRNSTAMGRRSRRVIGCGRAFESIINRDQLQQRNTQPRFHYQVAREPLAPEPECDLSQDIILPLGLPHIGRYYRNG